MNEKKQFIRGRPGMNSRAQIVKPAGSGFNLMNALTKITTPIASNRSWVDPPGAEAPGYGAAPRKRGFKAISPDNEAVWKPD